MISIHRTLAGSPTPNEISNGYPKPRVTLDSYHSTLSLCDNHFRVSSSRVSPDSYHSTLSLGDIHIYMPSSRVSPDSYRSTLSLGDNHVRLFSSLGQQNFSAYTSSLLPPHRNSESLPGSLTPTQKFRIAPRVSYTHTEIWNHSPGLLHPHRNFGIASRVSYTLTEILDNTTGLLHPHRNLGSFPGSLTPTQKFGIVPLVSYTHTEIRDLSPGLLHPHINFGIASRVSYTLTEIWITPRVSYTLTEIRDHSPGLLHPHRNSGSLPGSLTPSTQASNLRGLTAPFSLCPTHVNDSSFSVSTSESSLDVVPKTTQPTLTKSGECSYRAPTPDPTRCYCAHECNNAIL